MLLGAWLVALELAGRLATQCNVTAAGVVLRLYSVHRPVIIFSPSALNARRGVPARVDIAALLAASQI